MGEDINRQFAAEIAAVCAFAEGSGAEKALLLVDRGDDVPPLVIEAWPGGPVTIQDGDRDLDVPADAIAARDATPFADLRGAAPASSIHVHPSTGEISAPLGAVAHMAEGVRTLVRVAGGRSVATADFPTDHAERSLTIAAREGEPIVIAMGDQHFLL